MSEISEARAVGGPDERPPPERPGKIILTGFIFALIAIVLGKFLGYPAPHSVIGAREAMEADLGCGGSEQGGVIVCVSYFDGLAGVIFNNNEFAVTIIKEVTDGDVPQRNSLREMGTEWKRDFAPGELVTDPIVNLHVYHIFSGSQYLGILIPLRRDRTCPSTDRHCV